uniref:Ring finger protein 186 n=1 Tax=Corvus moneduloides TaxID=1196302 RepID=A0A8C3DEF5_CORMO
SAQTHTASTELLLLPETINLSVPEIRTGPACMLGTPVSCGLKNNLSQNKFHSWLSWLNANPWRMLSGTPWR